METLEGILPEHLLLWVTTLVTVCSAITIVLPTPKEGSKRIYYIFYKLIQWVALNLGKAKNGEPLKSSKIKDGQQ